MSNYLSSNDDVTTPEQHTVDGDPVVCRPQPFRHFTKREGRWTRLDIAQSSIIQCELCEAKFRGKTGFERYMAHLKRCENDTIKKIVKLKEETEKRRNEEKLFEGEDLPGFDEYL